MNEDIITSRSNLRLRHITALHQRKHRNAEGMIWIEGVKCVNELLNSAYSVQEIFVSTDAQTTVLNLADHARKKGHPVTRMSPHCFKKCSVLRHPEGIGAIAIRHPPRTLQEKVDTPAVILWQLKEPGNLGSIIRTAVGLGCRTILVVEPSVDVFHPMCIRGSAGVLFRAVLYTAPEEEMYAWLEAQAPAVAGLSGDGTRSLDEARQTGINILVVGNEPYGLPQAVRHRFNTIRLPMAHNVESINVTAAAAIAMYALWYSNNTQETT